MNIPIITPIQSTTLETKDVKTITFAHPAPVIPGQFYMIWIPGVDEIPMSVSRITLKTKAITFRDVGDATHQLFQLNAGSHIGIRGPYGNGFTIAGKHLLFVGGGTGIAMLAPAIEHARKQKVKTTVIIGVKTHQELFFEQHMKRTGATVYVTTDDGSYGEKGFASDLAATVLKKEHIDAVYTCGPELMMKTLHKLCKHIRFQASLERYMKCAMGLCGQCCVGDGLRVCVDGPIFDGTTLQKITDFGKYHRDAAGRKIMYK
ncbi:MAG: dihydroorotate dehydrogenase electron transfer subunit [Candidatus Thermoplasmatota archaeon]|nr:dihydroorotate dehydrogenase electron transfer subunit [Candidatus Thermoplasmatota archaeon]